MVVALGLLSGLVLLARIRTPSAAGSVASGTGVAIVVPARNEEATLPRLLASLADQRVRPDRLVVVDDGSEDRTAAVARAGGAELVPAPPPPSGWAGKPWACAVGVDAVRDSSPGILVFLDADTELGPDGLAAILGDHERNAPEGLLSIQPHHRTERFHEQLSAVGNLVSMMGSGAFTPFGSYSPPMAFGPCLVTSSEAYEDVGGHVAVAGEVIEDIHLARRYREAGRPVRCLAGGSSVSYRMYPAGLGQLVEGWSKNLAGGARLAPLAASLGAALWVATGCMLGVGGAEAVLAGWSGSIGADDWWRIGGYVVFAAQVSWALRRVGSFRWWVGPAYPLALAAFVALFLRSLALRLVLRRVTWRGRRLQVAPGRG